MNKLFVICLILGFWLFLPMIFIWLEVTNFDSQTIMSIKDNLENTQLEQQSTESTNDFWSNASKFFNNIGKFLSSIYNIISLYFQILIVGIPNAPALVNYFLWFLKIISASVLYLLLRGN